MSNWTLGIKVVANLRSAAVIADDEHMVKICDEAARGNDEAIDICDAHISHLREMCIPGEYVRLESWRCTAEVPKAHVASA